MLLPLRPALIAAVLLAVPACTTVTPEQRAAACKATDWADYGRNDGVLGVPAGARAKKFADCADLGHPADVTAYQSGRVEGLRSYCTLENGYEIGYSGRTYRNVCPPDLEPDFQQGYEQGRRERPYYGPYPHFGFGFGYGHYPYYGYPYWYFPHRRRHH